MKNRGQLIEIFISNLANAIVHQILEKATNEQAYIDRYDKEMKNSRQIAKTYREKINPANRALPFRDAEEVKQKIINKVNIELNLRISRGYQNINLKLVEEYIDKSLKEMSII